MHYSYIAMECSTPKHPYNENGVGELGTGWHAGQSQNESAILIEQSLRKCVLQRIKRTNQNYF